MKTSQDPRHQARRIALSVIYAVENTKGLDYSKVNIDLIETVLSNLEIENYDKKLCQEIIDNVSNRSESYKDIISQNSKDWEVSKIYKIDLSILLVAISELYKEQVPMKVVVDEAVELAKEFGEADSAKFINGVLAGVIKYINIKSTNEPNT